MKLLLFSLVIILGVLDINAQPASITNILVSQRTDGSSFVDIYFNLSGPANAYNISLEVSFNAGSTYTAVPASFLSGDVSGINPGSNKHIVWDGLGSFPNTFSTQARLELTATEIFGSGIPCPGMPTVIDIDGNVYNTVLIGNQCWMRENLRWLPQVSPAAVGSTYEPHYYVYSYQGSNVAEAKATTNYQIYGVLYNWQAALNACPAGWHLPSDEEWSYLIDYWGGTAIAGGKMKTTGTAYWSSPNVGATNESGFSAMPGGFRDDGGQFNHINLNCSFQSSTEHTTTNAWNRNMSWNAGNISKTSYNKARAFSIRCVKN